MVTDESDRRLNLYFDELDMDILEWLNSFGKRKRARVAKEAIRRAMNEGFRASSNERVLLPSVKPKTEKSSKPNESVKVENANINVPRKIKDPPLEKVDSFLLDLVGVEDDSKILSLVDQDRGVSI